MKKAEITKAQKKSKQAVARRISCFFVISVEINIEIRIDIASLAQEFPGLPDEIISFAGAGLADYDIDHIG